MHGDRPGGHDGAVRAREERGPARAAPVHRAVSPATFPLARSLSAGFTCNYLAVLSSHACALAFTGTPVALVDANPFAGALRRRKRGLPSLSSSTRPPMKGQTQRISARKGLFSTGARQFR
jgi:hypothetical protein